ncbi:MAG TPA: hypothetical protein VFW78_01515 [Bacteroidia bacterium]|nr:hypothetical protein [Bacteroidia bacterium]
MIKRSFFVFFLLVVMYSFVPKLNLEDAEQYPFQINSVKAQQFIYYAKDENVIVGSSLSARLAMDSLPGFYNLSFSGLGVSDGLNILMANNRHPRNLLVEMNYIFRPQSETFLSYINSPVLSLLKRHITSMQDRFQPIGTVGETIIRYLKGNDAMKLEFADKADTTAVLRRLENQVELSSEVPDGQFLNERFTYLKQKIAELEAEGVHVIFFEMPVHPTLCNSPRAKVVRYLFFRHFPPQQYQYIDLPDCNGYLTTDGLHLSVKEAVSYTSYMKKKMLPLLSS